MKTEPVKDSGAIISRDKKYRYQLWRTWDRAADRALFIMLNPSTADATKDDPTIRKIIGFARRWDYGGVIVANLFPFRSTSPALIPIRERMPNSENISHIDNLILHPRVSIIVCGWGNNGTITPDLQYWVDKGTQLFCLGTTLNGEPKHPLYVPYSQPLILFR